MKKAITVLFTTFLLVAINKSKAQNIVPNPGFENYSSCPLSYGEVNKCVNWKSFGFSPDYFNACSPDSIVNVPKNNFGFQYAASGIAYCGFINNSGGPAPPPEYIGAELTQQLIAGQKYYASLKISFAGNYCASNKMGIGLSTVPYDQLNPPPLNNNAVVYTDSIIKDTAGWYHIKGNFIADSNYTYIIIGNFFTNVSSCPAGTYISYYFVDDICLSTDSITCYSSLGINTIKNSETITLYPNPFSNELTIRVDNKEPLEITLYDLTSRKLMSKNFESFTTLNTEQLSYGFYIYELRNKNGLIKKGRVIKD